MDTSPLIDRRHVAFVLHEVLGIESLCAYPRFAEHSRETFDAALALAHQLAVDKFLAHNRKGDLEEPRLVDGRVELIPEIGEAVRAFGEAGFTAALADYERGGMQLPFVVTCVCDAMFCAANAGTIAYPTLARAAANLLEVYGTPEQQRLYMQPILEGRYLGTMCLSEPQAGSSLADLKTLATPAPDGTYHITGAKMWISAGDHELGENIVHLVLARITGAPLGVRGISLFVVPRWRVNADGTRGERNDVVLAGLNHKMGQRSSVNTFLKFGESGDCAGYLIGKPHEGLAQMFHMMNEERIGVGLSAIQQASASYRYSLAYAHERRQGRHPDQKDPTTPALPLIEHADVRRMLLQQKCYVEGGQMLAFHASLLCDRKRDPDPAVQRDAALLLELLTPIVKAWGSDYALRANDLAIQILGGYGYTREYPVEQCYRDNRINPIHEGTNGIQALDLLGRKAMMQDGAALRILLSRIGETCGEAAKVSDLAAFAKQLGDACKLVGDTTLAVGKRMAQGEIRRGLANAAHYMTLVGHVVVAWCWLRMALVAQAALAKSPGGDADFYRGKIQACRYYFAAELPQIEIAARLVANCEPSAFDMHAEWF
jgi:alkylation response protein AidB-like acyl-CoA dehydrogenase